MIFQRIGRAAWLALGILPLATEAKTIDVNCDEGQTIQQRLRHAEPGDRVAVTGTCNENVVVQDDRSGITLDGQGTAVVRGPDATQSTIVVRGGNITIRGFTIGGGENGVSVRDGGTALIDSNTIEGTGQDGISVIRHSSATIINNILRSNPRDGIVVTDSSSARIGFVSTRDAVASPNLISLNGRRGVTVSRSSNVRIVGNTITANADGGVNIVRASQADLAANVIDGNARQGIQVSQNSGANLADNNDETAIFAQVNTGTNDRFGVNCQSGAYVSGSLGPLTGTIRATNIAVTCVNDLAP